MKRSSDGNVRWWYAKQARAAWNRLWRSLSSPWLDAHSAWADTPNYYREHDLGLKTLKWGDGTTRRVKVVKALDTAGTTIYSIDPQGLVPLSSL